MLLKRDRGVSEEIIKSVRNPENPKSMTADFREGARILTVKSFLSSYAVRTREDYGFDKNSVYGIDWNSCYSSPVSNVQKIKIPLLVMGMTAGWEFAAAETIYDYARSSDKTIAYVEGATHQFRPAANMENSSQDLGDTVKTLFDFVSVWLRRRFN